MLYLQRNQNFLLPSKFILISILFWVVIGALHSQCSINFGTLGSNIIVENGGLESTTINYNIWDETTNDCSTSGGVADMSITYEMIPTFDAYGGTAVHTTNGTNYKVEYSATGLRGTLCHGNIPATRSSPGDVRCYKITVNFAPHVNNIVASDFEIDLTSVNTGGTAFESTALAFLDRDGNPYGSFDYSGYYQMNPGNTHPGIVASCPNSPPLPNISSTPWILSGVGVYSANANTVDITNTCVPAGGSSGPNDNTDVLASNTGLAPNAGIGGFVYQVCLENVGTFTSDVAISTVSTTFTSTLNGFTIAGQAMPLEWKSFDIKKESGGIVLDFTTVSESNCDYFDIERSKDGLAFYKIGTLKSLNRAEENHYKFVDRDVVSGMHYYRIKQVDFDGKYSYSHVEIIRVDDKNDVRIAPTITDNTLEIQTNSLDYDIEIIDAGGQVNSAFFGLKGDETLDVSSLASGIYILSYKTSEIRKLTKFVKL